jgi:hypothetical protein
MINFDNFHDSSLLTIEFNWESGLTKIFISPYFPYINSKEVLITCEETFILELKKELPWGESIFLNEISWKLYEKEKQIIEIEMQSGDKIIVGGKKINSNPID